MTLTANPGIRAEANEKFVNRERELATDCQTHLATASGADAAHPAGRFSPDWAKSIVEQLQEKQGNKR